MPKKSKKNISIESFNIKQYNENNASYNLLTVDEFSTFIFIFKTGFLSFNIFNFNS